VHSIWNRGIPGGATRGASPWLAAVLLFWIASLAGQAPEASVRGVVNNAEGQPLAGAKLTATHSETGFVQATTTDSEGRYYFGSLPRGLYSLKAEMAGYQGLEKRGVELAVGARHEENLTLSSLSTPQGQTAIGGVFDILPPAPSLPVETIASSVSVVVEENRILQLPLANRNIYSLFLLQPGVTSQGAIGSRGLTFSVHGQRVSGSNYLFDGVDNNNIVLTGPLAATSAEAIQEFRMVNSSFSAENGRATAFVAQVVTRSGTNRFHGSVFEFLGNDRLDANTFENKSKGFAKPPLRQNQFGYSLGGPIQRNRTFFWTGLEFSRLRFGTPLKLELPSSFFIANLPADSVARRLLTEIPPYPTTPTAADPNIGEIQLQAPGRIDSVFATERLDHHFANEKNRLAFRFSLASTSQEGSEEGVTDLPVGYPSLMPTDHFRAYNSMLNWTHSFDPSRVNDFRIGWSRERIELPRPRPDVAILQSFDDVLLPGSQRFLGIQENNNVIQIADTFSVRWGRSALTMGFEYRSNLSNGVSLGLESVAPGAVARIPDGAYLFPNLLAFQENQPFIFGLDVDRFSSGQLRLPDLRRKYRSNEYAALIQDDIRLSRHLSLNLGLRYEYYGVPHNIDRSKDVNFYFGQGSTVEERLANGVLRNTDQNPGDLKGLLYRPDWLNFAPSIGIAWDPFGRGRTVVRAGYAIAYDRIFDTIKDLRSNILQQVLCLPAFGCPATLQVPIDAMLPLLNQNLEEQSPPAIVQLDENLRTPYAENWYVGMQQTVTPNFLVEIGHAGSVGRKLISRDVINRFIEGVDQPNAQIDEDTFLSNAGNSNYLALEVSMRRRFSRGLQYQVSYTYSHAIDNQSDIFEGVRFGPRRDEFTVATFTRPFDARLDRGNANFDQRHNVVLSAIWDLPTPDVRARWAGLLLGGWTASVIGAHRSGFPVTVIGPTDFLTELRNLRVDLVGDPYLSPAPLVPGGVQWLNPDAFRPAAVDEVGNLGRGALKGPGFWNYDFALLRNIALTESVRLQFRAEFYNVFNHANLSRPVSFFSVDPLTGDVDPEFGRAYYGLNRTFSRFGDLPLENPSRRIQFGLRLSF